MSGFQLGALRPGPRRFTAAALCAAAALAQSTGCSQYRGKAYASPDEASRALVAALRPYDAARVRQVLGSAGPEVITSGDPTADRHDLEQFLEAYNAQHRFVTEEDGSMTLEVGDDDWPMPIPLVQDGGAWRFDTRRGADEIAVRRIGRNELSAIKVCLAIVDAQREYARLDLDGNRAHDYAQKFLSDPGQRNGLYWEAAEGQPTPPLGALVAEAQAEGYVVPERPGGMRSYHGYCYRLLSGQGPEAPGGARSYLTGRIMTGGFAVVAWPVAYDDSGVMTFLVNHTGVVYECDLGRSTARIASGMTVFDPGPRWALVDPAHTH